MSSDTQQQLLVIEKTTGQLYPDLRSPQHTTFLHLTDTNGSPTTDADCRVRSSLNFWQEAPFQTLKLAKQPIKEWMAESRGATFDQQTLP